ncbi:MAG: hypothetical protein GY798_24610 [Hyphomicrobiales bacterium]|nr:hypothetical protein [Hyphomicrobiales bacterium]
MRTLVVYYSLTGHTKGLAERIAGECDAEIERIKDAKDRSGAWARFSSGREALFNRRAVIGQTEKDPAQYDLVILGTPVWAWTMSSPMRTYLTQNASSLDRVAFFCTEGGAGGGRAFRHMSDLISKRPVATLEVTATDLKTGADKDKLKQFVSAIAGLSDPD